MNAIETNKPFEVSNFPQSDNKQQEGQDKDEDDDDGEMEGVDEQKHEQPTQ